MKNVRVGLIACIVLIIALITSCSTSVDEQSGRVKIVTTFYPLYDFASKIGGEHVGVEHLIPAGIDPHDWTPKPKDIAKMMQADVFIYNGAGFESWIEDMIDQFDENTVVLDISENIELLPVDHSQASDGNGDHEYEHEHKHVDGNDPDHEHDDAHGHEDGYDHDHGVYDPHFWTSPKRAMQMAASIRDGLIEVDADHERDYMQNYNLLMEQLEHLDEQLVDIVAQATRDHIVVTHHAFAYLAHDYGFRQMAIMGLSPEAEPTARQIQSISEFIKTERVQYILFEQIVSPKLAETLAEDLGIETLVFNPLEGLTDEQMASGEDYLSVMESNLQTLKKALR